MAMISCAWASHAPSCQLLLAMHGGGKRGFVTVYVAVVNTMQDLSKWLRFKLFLVLVVNMSTGTIYVVTYSRDTSIVYVSHRPSGSQIKKTCEQLILGSM